MKILLCKCHMMLHFQLDNICGTFVRDSFCGSKHHRSLTPVIHAVRINMDGRSESDGTTAWNLIADSDDLPGL